MTNPPVTEEAVEATAREWLGNPPYPPCRERLHTVRQVLEARQRAVLAMSPPVVSEGMRMLGAADEATELKARIEAIRDERNFPAHLLAATDELLEIAEALAMSVKSEAAPVPWTEIMGTDPADEMARKLDEGQ